MNSKKSDSAAKRALRVSPIRVYKMSDRSSGKKLHHSNMKTTEARAKLETNEISTPLFSKTSGAPSTSTVKNKGVSASSNSMSRNAQIKNVVE